MGTRSDIVVHRKDGKWHRVYCHWDGYLSGVGKTLFDHYNSQALAEKLVKPGDMSSLREKCTKPKGHTFDKPVDGYTVYYGRDRGETDVGGTIGDSLQACWPDQDTWTEFTYVWDDGKWWVGDPDEGTQTLIELEAALSGKKVLKPAIKAFGMKIGRHSGKVSGKV
jgi:hypothetical protein